MAMLRPRHWLGLVALAAILALAVLAVQALHPDAGVQTLAFWTAIALGMLAVVILEAFAAVHPPGDYPPEDHRGLAGAAASWVHRDHPRTVLVLWAVTALAMVVLGFLPGVGRALDVVLVAAVLVGALGLVLGDLARPSPRGE